MEFINNILNVAVFILIFYPINCFFASIPDYKPNPEVRYIKLLVYNLVIGFITFFAIVIAMSYYSVSIEKYFFIFSIVMFFLPQMILLIEENFFNFEE